MRRLLFLLALRGCCALPSRLADDDHAALEPGELESAQDRVPHKPLFERFLAPVRNDPISPRELTFRAHVDGKAGLRNIRVMASDVSRGKVHLFDVASLELLWGWQKGQSVPELKEFLFVGHRFVSLSFCKRKSWSLFKRCKRRMTLSAPKDLGSTRPLGLTLLHKLLTELRDGVLPAEPSYHLGYLIRLEEFRAAGAGFTGRDKKLPSRPNAAQPMLGVDVDMGKKLGIGGAGQVFLGTLQQRAWKKLEKNLKEGARVANYAVVVDGSDLHRAPPVIFKQVFAALAGGDFDTEVKQSLKLMAHEFVGRTVPPGASHIVRMYGRLVSTQGEEQEGLVFEQMTDDLTVLTKALPAYTAEAIHRRRLGVVRIVMQTLDGLRFLHSRGAAHLDMKEDNVMYRVLPDRKVLVKLIDFGQMQWKRRDAELLVIQSTDEAAKEGTLEFLSPARLATYECSTDDSCDDVVTFDAQKDDVWAVGLMLLSMLSPGAFAGKRRGRELLAPDIDKEDKDAYLKINNKKWMKLVNDAVSPKRARLLQDERSANAQFVKLLRGVLKGMLEPNEAARLTADEAHYELWTVMATAGSYGLQDPVEGLNG